MTLSGHPVQGERWERLHKTGYTLMIGRRLKRIREGRHLTQQTVDEAEMTLIKFLRRTGISVDEAIARLARR